MHEDVCYMLMKAYKRTWKDCKICRFGLYKRQTYPYKQIHASDWLKAPRIIFGPLHFKDLCSWEMFSLLFATVINTL